MYTDLPSSMTLRRNTVHYGSTEAVVLLEWDPLTYRNQPVTTNYTIATTNSQDQFTRTNMINVSVVYNNNFTVEVVATYCKAISILETFKIGKFTYINSRLRYIVIDHFICNNNSQLLGSISCQWSDHRAL